MLRNGEYKEAKYLKENDSLMPLYRKYPSRGLVNYRMYYEPMEDRWHYEHRNFAKEVLDEKYLVHHKDCNSLNNNPDNLIWMSRSKHQNIHAEIETGAHSKEASKKRSESLSKYYKNNRDNPTFIERNKKISETLKNKVPIEKRIELENLKLSRKEKAELLKEEKIKKEIKKEEHIKEIETAFNVRYEDLSISERNSYGVKLSRLKNPNIQKRISAAVSENHKKGKYENAKKALQEYNNSIKGHHRKKEDIDKMVATKKAHGPYTVSEETKQKISKATSNKRWYNNGKTSIYINKDEIVPEGFIAGRIKTWKNHKVRKIYYIDELADVYDLTIEDNHNFALSSGVFVHNSKDQSDAVCGALWNASQHADEFNFEYGEDIDSIIKVSSQKALDEKQQIILDFEEELKNATTIKGEKIVNNIYNDFGAGKATTNYNPFYVMDGIVVF